MWTKSQEELSNKGQNRNFDLHLMHKQNVYVCSKHSERSFYQNERISKTRYPWKNRKSWISYYNLSNNDRMTGPRADEILKMVLKVTRDNSINIYKEIYS